MSTVNISMPAEQVSFLDSLITKYGFASRSEFVRNLLRLVNSKPHIIEEAGSFPFRGTPPNQSVKEVMTDFRKTKKYSKAFLKDLESGLKSSSYFRPWPSMLTILPLSAEVQAGIIKHGLQKKFSKQLALFQENLRHPSLHVEVLEPKSRGFNSFRIDRKYRAIFIHKTATSEIEILAITVHYQ